MDGLYPITIYLGTMACAVRLGAIELTHIKVQRSNQFAT